MKLQETFDARVVTEFQLTLVGDPVRVDRYNRARGKATLRGRSARLDVACWADLIRVRSVEMSTASWGDVIDGDSIVVDLTSPQVLTFLTALSSHGKVVVPSDSGEVIVIIDGADDVMILVRSASKQGEGHIIVGRDALAEFASDLRRALVVAEVPA